ncbi:Spc7 kinetochore protein-domain-containing protein [Scheffersomyces coipomensis]|uniref:Spc7 kinetochore protein-domain-containing protein n=1 Tax=Scheffersomyces coipomensis TaxID=1788519 RepID=UPI00315D3CC5
MSPTSNKENINLGPFSPSFKHPSKSILRDNTLPILNDKRRVSFAPEVTLHKFDFIPTSENGTSKRRKTISGSIPSSQEFDSPVKSIDNEIHVNGLEVLEDSSDESSLDSIENIESPEKVIPEYPSNSFVEPAEAEEDQEEETMELTGQIQNINDHIQETLSSLVTMTQTTSSAAAAVEFPSDDESDNDENADMELTGPQAFIASHHQQPEEQEVTMEITMDITEVYNKTLPPPVLEVITEASEESSQDPTLNNIESQNVTESVQEPLQFDGNLHSLGLFGPIQTSTQQDSQESNTNISNKLPQNEEEAEVTMDVTKVGPQIIHRNQEIEDSTNDIENTQQMELTQVSNIISTTTEQEIEDTQQMELTQVPTTIQKVSEVEIEAESVEDIQGSQPMELTQVDSTIISNVQIEVTEENQTLPQSPNSSVASISERLISTTKIPLAEVSTIEDVSNTDENYEDVTLSTFLEDIGVKFYDDLDIDVNSMERLSISSTTDLTDNTLEDYIKALPKLELLALYQFSCDELSNNIRDGRKMYSEYSKTIQVNNPVLFKEYYASDDDDKSLMNVRLQLIKDHTRFQSKKTWYDWRTQLTNNLIIELDNKRDQLIQDQEKIKSDIQKLDESYNLAKEILITAKQKLQSLRSIQGQISSISVDELQKFKSDLISSKMTLQELKASSDSKEQALTALKEKISDINESIRTLQLDISVDEKIITKNRKYEVNEIDILKQKFSFVQKLSKLKYLGLEESELSYEFDELIICKFNFKDISDHSNIVYSLNTNTTTTTFHNKELVNKYALKLTTINPGSTIIDNFKSFKVYWNALKKLDSDLYTLSLKHPITYLYSEESIKFEIRYYSFENDFKLLLECNIAFVDLPKQDHKLEITAKLQRSKLEVDESLMKREMINKLGTNLLFSNHSLQSLKFT